MATWVDFRDLREHLDFARVLRHFGVELRVRGNGQHQGFCPLPTHQGTRRSPSFSANLPRKVWHCFGCGAKGNALDFAARMHGLDPDDPDQLRRAALDLARQFAPQAVKATSAANPRPRLLAQTLQPPTSIRPGSDGAQENAGRAGPVTPTGD